MIYRVIVCDKCEAEYREKIDGLGFPKWGHIRGFVVDGVERDLHFCPRCLDSLKDLLKTLPDVKEA